MEDREQIERSAKTVDEAIEIGLLELGVSRAEVEVDVLSKGRSGILGIGSELSRVKLTKINQDTGNPSSRCRFDTVFLRVPSAGSG